MFINAQMLTFGKKIYICSYLFMYIRCIRECVIYAYVVTLL